MVESQQRRDALSELRHSFRHPAWRRPGQLDSGDTNRALSNLHTESEILHAALGIFSGLSALERENWPAVPRFHEWRSAKDGLVRLPFFRSAPSPGAAVPDHIEGFFRLLGGRLLKDGKALGTVPRRHPHFPQLNAWFRSLRSEGSWARVPASELAVSIALLMDELEIPNHLPPEWGFSFFWRPRSGLFKKPGLQSVQAAASPIVQAILDSALAAGLGCVDLTLAMPYPYSCLEPVAEELLGRGREDARRWLAEKLEGGAGALTESVAGLLRQAGRGVAVWPGHRLDQASREVLADAALRAGRTALVLERDGDAAGGTLSRLRWLWLPETAEKWYMRHAGELYRDRLEKLVAAVSSLPPGEPRCGRPLIPPALPSAPKSPARQKWFNPWVWETHSPCRAWSASSYLAASNQPEGAAFLKGMALLRAGQASLALDAWRDLTDPPVAAEHLAVQRERALERLQAYETILEQPESDRLSSLAGRDRTAHLFLAGQSAWILGETAQGRKTLEEGLASSTRADEQAQGHCHLATLDLYQGQIASAEERLREAEEHLPSKPEPLTLFLLHHRRGWVQRSRGDFESALSHFRAAGSAARKGGDCRLEAASEGEAGNVLRLMCRFEDALPALRRAEDGARALGLQEAAETARFNRILCSIASGGLRSAVRELNDILAREKGGPIHQAIDLFWLGLVQWHLGELPDAMTSCEKAQRVLARDTGSSIRLPLAILKGRLLLETHQRNRLQRHLRLVSSLAEESTEPDDALEAAALKLSCAARGIGNVSGGELAHAEQTYEKASHEAKAAWLLALSAAEGEHEEARLLSAWEIAHQIRNPSLACRALWRLACLNALPALAEEERRWILLFLKANRLRRPERELAAHVQPSSNGRERTEGAPSLSSDLALLRCAGTRDAGRARLEFLNRLGCSAGMWTAPGGIPEWWGEADESVRRRLLSASGMSGSRKTSAGWIIGGLSRRGAWCGLWRQGGPEPSKDEETLVYLWAGLEGRRAPPTPVVREAPRYDFLESRILGQSPAMRDVRRSIQEAAPFNFPVLLLGEPGVGKEACAAALHHLSPRHKRNWVPANCANLSPTLAASLLFGHRRGAFTGADRDREGLVAAAEGSTLFLDEIGELPIETQAQLLRFLQDGSFTPLGASRPRRSDVRIIAATNRDLEAAIRQGRFRADLYHRLNVIPIRIPPLRERLSDVPVLFDRFLGMAAEGEAMPRPELAPEIYGRLAQYAWPGNVRELQNAARHALVKSAAKGRVTVEHLPEAVFSPAPPSPGSNLKARLRLVEARLVREALAECGGNFAQAARRLGLSRQALHAKVRSLHLSVDRAAPDTRGGHGG